MEPKRKSALGLGAALAALFVGTALCAAPASAAMPIHAERLTTSVFDQRDGRNHDRDDHNRHDNGNHNGWDKQHDQWVRERERQAREREKWLREQAQRRHNDRDTHYYRHDTPSNGDDHRGHDNHDWGRSGDDRHNAPPPPPSGRDRHR